jgi:SAM-dependent methyltransferase
VPSFDELVSEALAAPFSGWDFSWLAGRSAAGRLPWSYQREVARRAATADTLLDMGTGGGERLSGLAPRPQRTVATEAWPPNVPVAAARLRPLGIPVVQDEGAPDNMHQDGAQRGRMPFSDGAFALVANRHEAFLAAEVARVLARGGIFLTQQVDFHAYDDLYRIVGLHAPEQPASWLPLALQQVRDAGLIVLGAVRGAERHEFHDVGALVYYLRVVGWAIPEYNLGACEAALRAAHETPALWPVSFRQRHFLLAAAKPQRSAQVAGSAGGCRAGAVE